MKKKKVRKEFVIVGAVLVVFALTFIISKVAGKGGLYDKSNVTVDFTDDGTMQDTTVDGELNADADYGYEGIVASVDEEELPEDAMTTNGTGSGQQYVVEDDNILPEPVVEVGPETRLTPQQYVNLAAKYLCGTKDENFDSYLSVVLKSTFNARKDEEPYSSLYGNTTFSNMKISDTDSSFSFTAGDGNTYTVMVLFNGSLISSIEVIDKG